MQAAAAVLVYLAVHKDHGTYVWFPFHGAKHGGHQETKTEGMYNGFDYWYDDPFLTDTDKKTIKQLDYFNYPFDADKHKDKRARLDAAAMDTEIDGCQFKVCTLSLLHVDLMQCNRDTSCTVPNVCVSVYCLDVKACIFALALVFDRVCCPTMLTPLHLPAHEGLHSVISKLLCQHNVHMVPAALCVLASVLAALPAALPLAVAALLPLLCIQFDWPLQHQHVLAAHVLAHSGHHARHALLLLAAVC